MKAINLDTYSLSLLTAKEDILNPRSSTNWALFNYDGATNNLKLSDSGAGGLSELAEKFHESRPLYGLCRMAPLESGQRRIVLIAWVGEGVGEQRREECISHIPAIKAFFKEANAFITANCLDDVAEERINIIISKTGAPPERIKRSPRAVDKEETVGTNYRKTNAAMEMHRINRESFWARAEREEEERKEEERRRAAEDRRRLEKERVLQERREAEERDRKMEEKLQMIEEQRRLQAKQDAEMRKQEKSKWEQQQREHEEDMRARFRRSESIEKAAEAAALVSQRSMNPREFFRQLSSSSMSSTSPGSPRTVKPPFRRYQRSLTDTAFIFGRADTPSSPRSPPLGSPFSRTPTSPFPRPMSPNSPAFFPSNSTQRSPPSSSLPKPPRPTPAQPDSPTRPAAPSQPLPLSPAAPPTVAPASPDPRASLDSPSLRGAPTAPLPDAPAVSSLERSDVYVATRMLSDLEPEADLTVQALLVDTSIAPVAEEEEEEEEEEEARPSERKATVEVLPDKAEVETSALASPLPNSETEPVEGTVNAVLVMATEAPDEAEPGQEEEPTVDDAEEAGRPGSEPAFCAPAVAPALVEQAEEEEEPEAVSHPDPEPIRTEEATDAVDANRPTPHEEAVHPANGMNGGEDIIETAERNGTERSVSPSEKALSPRVPRHDGTGDDIITENTENGEEVSLDGQLCVRALYDYQAGDESELSLEPGDIISDVEAVDKAWWRGCSKDGRQGLFPANYVETI
ncbi:drebrin-like protein [Anguilla anguilla]|uniref:drebrin-like protein n=1 Tax=Anguilla anguilla TaxID=7936 RepID=UPI0015AAB563|nr:drebrin-like protein [Anguilla anguilla]